MRTYELLIVGGGAAGMAAALAAEEAGARRILLAERGEMLGGILPQCIHHGFGLGCFHADLTGPEFAARFAARMQTCRAEVRLETAVLSLRADRTALLSGPSGVERVGFGRCILACGAREKPLGALPVSGTRPAGVFTAGQAQKLVNLGHYDIGSRIVILGSGDIGQIMARRFTLCGKTVVAMVELSDRLGGLARNRRECIEAYRIPVILGATVTAVHGFPRVDGVTVRRSADGAEERLACDTLVTAVGLIPERELARPLAAADGSLPDWLAPVGNCDFIHEIVDAVTAEAARTAAALVRA